MRLVIVLLTLASAMALAQGTIQDVVTPDDLLMLYDNAVALEVDIPTGATTFALSYGSSSSPLGLSTFLPETRAGDSAPTRLRVVVVLPDASVVDPCVPFRAEAVVIAVPHGPSGTDAHHRQKVCVPHPSESSMTGELTTVIEGPGPQLGEWTPLVLKTWLVNVGQDGQGTIQSIVDLEHNFLLQVHFGDSNTTGIVTAPPLGTAELMAVPAIRALVEEYGLLRAP